jgi:hypothetical protein
VIISEASGLYHRVEDELQASDGLVRLALVGVIVVSIFLLVQPSRSARLTGALWFVMP